MKISYQRRLLPMTDQLREMTRRLDMFRLRYDRMLAERFQWWQENRSAVNSLPLSCHLPLLKERPNYYSQPSSLIFLKKERPRYKNVYSQVLQDMVKQVDNAFEQDIKRECRRIKPKRDESETFLPNRQTAKSGLNQSIADASWGQLVNILSVKAEKAGGFGAEEKPALYPVAASAGSLSP
jgi:transposase